MKAPGVGQWLLYSLTKTFFRGTSSVILCWAFLPKISPRGIVSAGVAPAQSLNQIILCVPADDKQRSALLVAACLIAAIRLRGEPIQPSPKLKATIYDSVQLAVLDWREIQNRGSSLGRPSN